MRVGFLLTSLNAGGAERVQLDLATQFAKLGHEIHLVLMDARPGLLHPLVPPEVEIVDLGCPRLWTSTLAVARYLRSRRPDAVIAAMPLANAVAVYARALSRVKPQLLLAEHNTRSLAFGDLDRLREALLAPAIQFAYRFGDQFVGVSQGVAERLGSMPGVRRDRVHMIYNPAYSPRIEAMAREPAPHAWLQNPSGPIVLSIGRLEKQKDFATLLRAFAYLRARRPARLVILGEGSQRGRLEQLARRLQIADAVSMPGFVANPWAFIRRASVFALSSVHEGFGNVLVEALALGVPVVSTDCPSGPSEILADGRFGQLVPVRDPAALGRAIDRALDAPVDKAQMQRRARAFSIEAASTGYLQALGLA
jgi:glycosyltransferase involved in cell wall biosynthesis